MKILSYRIKNVRGISEMTGNLDGRSVYVIGGNGQGKSSFIQAIFLACKLFGNKPYIKQGEDKGIVQLQIGEDNSIEYTIERAFTANGETVLTIRDAKGKALNKVSGLTPQKWLDKLLGTSMYYLSEFLEEDPKKQVKMFKEWFKIDTTELDKKYQTTYDERTEEGREEVRLKKVVEGYHFGYDDQKKYADKKEITEISKKLVEINQIENDKLAKEKEIKTNTELRYKDIDATKEKIRNTEKECNNIDNKILESNDAIKEWQEEIERLTANIQDEKEKIETERERKKLQEQSHQELKDKLDQDLKLIERYIGQATDELSKIIVPEKTDIEQEIKDAEEFNKKVDQVAKYSADLKLLQEQEKKRNDLTKELKDIEAERKKKLEEANVPVPGLTFDENSLIYEDKPFIKDVINDAKMTEILLTLFLRTNQEESKKTGEDKLSIFRINGGDLTDKTFNEIMEVVKSEGGEVFVELPDDDVEGVEIKFIEEK